MVCRLNPLLVEGTKVVLSAIGLFSIAFIILISYWAICIGLIWSVIHQFELYGICAQFASSTGVYDTLASYELDTATGIVALFHLALVLGFIGIVASYAMCEEIAESYSYKKRQLEYKFQGKQMPWYRVLISYIIVCDGK